MVEDTQSEIYRKMHGIYYTPKKLARIIVESIIDDKDSTILDPSFGTGVLLKAAGEKLVSLGNQTPEHNLYGVDIDSTTLINLGNPEGFSLETNNLLIGNFLSLEPKSLERCPYDIILSNPPFTRHHDISPGEKTVAKEAMEKHGFQVHGHSGYWVYFLLHSLQFLKIGGSISFLVPYAILDSFYSKKIQRIIEFSFESVTLHILKPKYFTDAQEHVLLLEARNYRGLENSKRGVFQLTLNGLDGSENLGKKPTTEEWSIDSLILSSKIRTMISKIRHFSDTVHLGDIAKVRIGVVTGGNQYFIIDKKKMKELELDYELVQPIITRSNMISCLDFRKSHFTRLKKNNESVFLLKLDMKLDLSKSLKKYLNSETSFAVRERYHCRNRSPWYSVKIGKIPDAFLHYMASYTPRLVDNKAIVTSTNTIHRIYWKRKLSTSMKRIISLGSLTSLSNLYSEILGRRLSGGLLKIEPSQAASMLVPIPDIDIDNSDWKIVNSYLEKKQMEQAIEFADDIILENGLGLKSQESKLLRNAANKMKHYRFKRNI